MSLINYQIIVLTEKFSNFGGSFIGRFFFYKVGQNNFRRNFSTCTYSLRINAY